MKISFLRSSFLARHHHCINSVSSGRKGSVGSVGRLMLQQRSENSSASAEKDRPSASARTAPFGPANTVMAGSADADSVAKCSSADETDIPVPVRFEFAPPEYVTGTPRCPPHTWAGDIIREASCIAYHYSKLKEKDFLATTIAAPAFPPIPGPSHESVEVVVFHDAWIPLNTLVDRIRDPPEDYVFLSELPPGSYICNEIVSWPFGNISTALYKR